MKKPVVDYREFRISKINEPRFSHLKLLGGWVLYFALYLLTENLIPPQDCHEVHIFLDDMIPFCELFVIPYVGWYALTAFSLAYFALYDIESFKSLSKFIIITQFTAMAAYIVYPSIQNLRPETFPRDNALTDAVALIYRLDTNTNVCPSLHVAYSIGIASVWLKKQDSSVYARALVAVFCALVCLSTAFIKQHSVFDGIAAIPMCVMAELIVFRKRYFRKHA